eukprot:CAMPEP_0177632782 /NCGR_PEP_ID=MMETSP0447-20121125/2488_1 /TAXON_ID=0 /ORGANISM="Stygamoeba regulata, Strain BSH-02190019" /LENGTH=791 /DNA_ID=CAMNT_0019134399 /DNA_START=55 /DNA_END=2430 /DNA_ORIENTATION=+
MSIAFFLLFSFIPSFLLFRFFRFFRFFLVFFSTSSSASSGTTSVPRPNPRIPSPASSVAQAADDDEPARAALFSLPSSSSSSSSTAVASAGSHFGDSVMPEPTIDLNHLDITTHDIDFVELDELIDKFQKDDRVKDALDKGFDMREYSKQVHIDLRQAETDSVLDYFAAADDVVALYNEIEQCDGVLKSMETILGGFQNDLGSISNEIKSLQAQSSSLSCRLKNRQSLGEKLNAFVENVAISPTMAEQLCGDEINEAYLELVNQLHRKKSYVEKHKTTNRACADVLPSFSQLCAKVSSRVRTFLLQKIQELAKPKVNMQVLQGLLLRFKVLNRFIQQHAPTIATEVRTSYIETVSTLLQRNASRYIDAMMKLVNEIASRDDLLGAEEGSLTSFFSFRPKDRSPVFAIGQRASVLQNMNAPLIVPSHVGEQKLYYEEIFRSLNLYLLDLVTSEYLFDVEFFGKVDLFTPILGKVTQLFVANLRDYLSSCFDCIGILLLIRIARGFLSMANQRQISVLRPYFESSAKLLWPRFQLVFSMHVASMNKAIAEGLSDVDTRRHTVTRRYADFASAMHVCNVTYKDGRLQKATNSLRALQEKLLLALCKSLPNEKTKIVFLINNYDHILTVMGARIAEDTDLPPSETMRRFELLKNQQVARFIDLELRGRFGALITYVSRAGDPDAPGAAGDEEQFTAVVKSFRQQWKKSLALVKQDITSKYFQNFASAASIFIAAMDTFREHYATLERIFRARYKQSPIAKDFIPATQLHYELDSLCADSKAALFVREKKKKKKDE